MKFEFKVMPAIHPWMNVEDAKSSDDEIYERYLNALYEDLVRIDVLLVERISKDVFWLETKCSYEMVKELIRPVLGSSLIDVLRYDHLKELPV